MSSEFSCQFCSAYPRNPCESRAEAAACPNCDNPGAYLDFDPVQVALWIRSRAQFKTTAEGQRLEAAAQAVENLC